MTVPTQADDVLTDEAAGQTAESTLEVRRRAGLAVALGAGASLVAIAYLARAVGSGGARLVGWDWAVFLLLGLIGVVNLAALLDARTPLLVADELGVRLRLGRTWVGLPWSGLDAVEHRARRGLLHDGAIVLRPTSPERVLDDLDGAARLRVRISARLQGEPLAVPLGVATRVVGASDVVTALRDLAQDRAEVVDLTVPDESRSPRFHDPRPAVAHLIGVIAGRLAPRTRPVDDDDDDLPDTMLETEPQLSASATPEPTRTPVSAARAEVRHEARAQVPDPAETQAWTPHELASALSPVRDEPVADEPVEPVIGPVFAAARARLGLDVEELAERTRIRPHVIEAIEVDDFTACGGDFYARGHLRTLARVLGVEVLPLLTTYDEDYAAAPIDPRRVFEAELASGSIRATRGGPNWSVLVAAVMALVLCWSVARLLTDGSHQLPDRAYLSGSGGPNHSSASLAQPVPVVVDAAAGGARVVVRDGAGKVVFSGDLSFGQRHTLRVSPPVRIQTTDGSLRVTVAGQDRGAVGTPGSTASASYVVRH